MSPTLFSARAGRLSLWLGGAALALVTFVRITRELVEGEMGAMDSAILLAVAKKRTPSSRMCGKSAEGESEWPTHKQTRNGQMADCD